jgi:hypothetical protein
MELAKESLKETSELLAREIKTERKQCTAEELVFLPQGYWRERAQKAQEC